MENTAVLEEIRSLQVEDIDQRAPNVADYMFKVIMIGDPGKQPFLWLIFGSFWQVILY